MGKCTNSLLDAGGRRSQARMGTAALHCDPAGSAPGGSLPCPPAPALPWDGSHHLHPCHCHLLQNHLRARTFAVRAEELPRDSRKPDTLRCSPCGSWHSRGMSQPRLLSLLLLLLCCQVRTGCPAGRGSALRPVPAATPGHGTAQHSIAWHISLHLPVAIPEPGPLPCLAWQLPGQGAGDVLGSPRAPLPRSRISSSRAGRRTARSVTAT